MIMPIYHVKVGVILGSLDTVLQCSIEFNVMENSDRCILQQLEYKRRA